MTSGGRFVAGAALAATVFAFASCGGGPSNGSADRERAYRANNRGVALLEQFAFDQAAETFREALRLDPRHRLATINLPIALFYAGKRPEAAAAATAARAAVPDAPQPPYMLGLIARAENRPDAAIEAFRGVLRLDPSDVGSKVNLALLDVQQRAYADAVVLCESALALEPYNATAAYNLGLALTRSGQTEAGQRALQRFQDLRASAYAVTYSGTYLEEGRYAEAVASTGAEADLVNATPPRVTFHASQTGASSKPGAPPALGRSVRRSELTPEGLAALARGLGGGLTLIDFDGDGALDVFIADAAGERLLHNDGRGGFADVTRASGLVGATAGAVPIGAVAGDYDNDGLADLLVIRYGGNSLYHNDGRGRFTDVTARAGLGAYPYVPGAAAFVDVDHDGDLDVVIAGLADFTATRANSAAGPLVFPADFAGAPLQLLRNNGNGTFADITAQAHLASKGHAIAIVPTDFDNRRDVDLLIVNRDAPPMLFKNLRDGTFRDVAADVGLSSVAGVRENQQVWSVAAADVNKDDYPDFFFSRGAGALWAMSDGHGRFSVSEAPGGSASAVASQLLDYDNDGLLDLLTMSAAGTHLFRNLGRSWSDVTAGALQASGGGAPTSARALAVADVTGDGAIDVVAGAGEGLPVVWTNSGNPDARSVRVELKGRVSNRLGVGSKIDMRAGSLSARVETASATPAVAPADLVFGLGGRAGADVIRVLWPSGILQAEAADAAAGRGRVQRISIQELDRKPSSCPFLFTWNGERFEFITDFMGGGEMGYLEAPGQHNTPDPVEYVRIRQDQLRAKDGRFEIRVTNELEEALFADRFQLLAIAHPADLDLFPNEGMTETPRAFRLFAVRDRRPPAAATDDHGHDMQARIAHVDRTYPDDFRLEHFRGFAEEHNLVLDLGVLHGPAVLLLTGWTDYAFSSDNLAGQQAGLQLRFPSLDVKTTTGAWRTAMADIGIPVGRPQSMVVDLSAVLRTGEHEVRVRTNMPVYWDQVQVATLVPSDSLRTMRIDPSLAMLRERGFSAVLRPDDREPETYDYQHVSPESPWKAMPGRYTRVGDVRKLLQRADDMFVIAKPGDEIALSFEEAQAGPLPAGWTRTFLLLADGFSKEMDVNSASPDLVEPLPFHAMTRYPYPRSERYPDSHAYLDYRDTYNTRVVVRPIPRLVVR